MDSSLHSLEVDQTELDSIEAMLREFNIFDLLGSFHLELVHSRILGFLLDPTERHGGGDWFARAFLELALRASGSPALLSGRETFLEQATVKREVHVPDSRGRIDILFVSPINRLVAIVENKVFSQEHSDQLGRYRRWAEEQYPDPEWRRAYILLSPAGESPTDRDYIAVSYENVAGLIDQMLLTPNLIANDAQRLTLEHYSRKVKGGLLMNHDIAARSKRFYDQHKDAIDTIWRFRNYPQAEIQQHLNRIVQKTPQLVLDQSPEPLGRYMLRFRHTALDHLPLDTCSEIPWTKSKRMILFQFDNYSSPNPSALHLSLIIGPGCPESRESLLATARTGIPDMSEDFHEDHDKQGRSWITIYHREYLRTDDYINLTFEGIRSRIDDRWQSFVNDDLDRLVAPFAAR